MQGTKIDVSGESLLAIQKSARESSEVAEDWNFSEINSAGKGLNLDQAKINNLHGFTNMHMTIQEYWWE